MAGCKTVRVVLSMIVRNSLSLTEFSVSYGCLRINETNGKDKLGQTHDCLFSMVFFMVKMS